MRTMILWLTLLALILSSCAPAPTTTPAPSATLVPTATATSMPAPTTTPTVTPTATATPIPTIQVGDLTFPDPRYSNPELFDLSKPDTPIPQFVNAMKMAGIEISTEQVAQEIAYREMKRKDGTAFVIVTFHISQDIGSSLSGEWPLMSAYQNQETEAWIWTRYTLRNLADANAVHWRSQMVSYMLRDPTYTRAIIENVNGILIDGEFDWKVMFLNNYFSSDQALDRAIRNMIDQLKSGNQDQIRFNFREASLLIDFAQEHDMDVVANHIFAPPIVPDSVIKDVLEGKIPYEDFEIFLEFYTRTLVRTFRGKVQEWSTANEVSAHYLYGSTLTKALVRKMLQKGTLVKLSQWVAEEDPDVVIAFNESIYGFGRENEDGAAAKLYRTNIEMLSNLLESGAKYNKIGIQNHRSIFFLPATAEQMERSARTLISATGISHFGTTESTVAISPDAPYFTHARNKFVFPDKNYQVAQAELYLAIAQSTLAVGGDFTTFGLTDRVSLYDRNNLNVPEAAALLLDENYQPKLAYYYLAKFLYERCLEQNICLIN